MSWNAGDDVPPPKPSRVPQQVDSSSMLSLGENAIAPPQTYIIAQNAAVLAQLMRENENRPLNASAYNTPATVFNTLGVHVDVSKNEPLPNEMPILPLKTVMLPASELLKLNPMMDDNSHANKSYATNSINTDEQTMTFGPQLQSQNDNARGMPPIYPTPCEIINTKTQQIHSIDPIYKQTSNLSQSTPYSPNLPPLNGDSSQKSRSLERSASRISSLDRAQNSAQFKQLRSNSLTRQFSSGTEISVCNYYGSSFITNSRSGSLERGARIKTINYGFRTNSSECGSQICPQKFQGESLERNQSVGNSHSVINMRNFQRGSLERNHQAMEATEPFQEAIYDFGGANVKSCASIALSKSISKGLIPPGKWTSISNQTQNINTSPNLSFHPANSKPANFRGFYSMELVQILYIIFFFQFFKKKLHTYLFSSFGYVSRYL
ncbi:uncharacterized protein LOC129571947 isoform X2 [Sitodiplosis mosellana]|uniref:uncharacterized protein LOC129571947 isoform X2 n=1 Tax=Sitodiplosis mosellana TaxID=263140 RepID=UPI0024443C44|nr:uncharacterized protein LOC129571947 isoform X2 [Sitodiplosis mosellana]